MIRSTFTTTVHNRYFEEYVAGSVHEFGSIMVEQEEVLAFGRRFVPLPYHTDPELAKESVYGGLIASGWHTASLMMRLYTDNYLSELQTLVRPEPMSCAGTNRYTRGTFYRSASQSWRLGSLSPNRIAELWIPSSRY